MGQGKRAVVVEREDNAQGLILSGRHEARRRPQHQLLDRACFASAWKKCLLVHPRLRASSMKRHQGRRENEVAHLHEPSFVLVGARQDGEECQGLVAKSVHSRLMGLLAETLKWERSVTV